MVLLALVGPLIAPHSVSAPVGAPYLPPADGLPLGTDHLGRDMWSRVLVGGLPLLVTSLAAVTLGSVIGGAVGLAAAVVAGHRGRIGGSIIRPLDALAAIPPMLVLLLALTAAPSALGTVVAVAVISAPLTARVVVAAAAPLMHRPHVEIAVARGERWWWLVGREVLPLVTAPIMADLGLRFVLAVYLVTAAGFLGVGPTGTDWGTLIVEALPGAALQPVALVAPLLLVATLAVSVNILSDSVLHRSRSVLA